MAEQKPCTLCGLERGVVARSEHWTMAVNENQATLGRVFFAVNRHETDVTALTPEEVADLWAFLGRAREALAGLFTPDHYNYMFHMNIDPHAHFHIYPRYRTPREFAGRTYADPDFGGHYDPNASHPLDDVSRDALVSALRSVLDSQGARP
jgi:diadenosine tetraphosphate (Ap4A) HIT family hydrolase